MQFFFYSNHANSVCAILILGSQDGVINIWDIQTPTLAFASIDIRPLKQLESHTKPSQVVKFNPRYLMMVSGCTDLVSIPR